MKYRIAKKYLNNLNPVYENITKKDGYTPIEIELQEKPAVNEKIELYCGIKHIKEIIHYKNYITLVIS